MHRYALEKYSSKSRFNCPGCGQSKVFTRYVSTETGAYLFDDVGRCDRESSCGYHYTPKQFFADNPRDDTDWKGNQPAFSRKAAFVPVTETKACDYLEKSHILETLTDYEQNSFVQFLLNLFPDDTEIVWQTVKNYLVGTYKDFTVFPRVSQGKKVCTAKLMKFDHQTGKRLKTDYSISSLPYELKRAGKIKQDFETDKRVFFGEHLLAEDKQKLIAIVEAEKTAIIGAMCFPEFIWLATGSKQFLKVEKLTRLGNRKIVLYPDADGFTDWRKIAQAARFEGLTVNLSGLIEKHATSSEKQKQFDLADYLINQQKEINEFNAFVDCHNSALEKILTDTSLKNQFN